MGYIGSRFWKKVFFVKNTIRQFQGTWYSFGDSIKKYLHDHLFLKSIKFIKFVPVCTRLVCRYTKFYLQRIVSSQENREGQCEQASPVLQRSQIVLSMMGYITSSILGCADCLFRKYHGNYCYFHPWKILYMKKNLFFTKICKFSIFDPRPNITFRCIINRTCNSYTVLSLRAKQRNIPPNSENFRFYPNF